MRSPDPNSRHPTASSYIPLDNGASRFPAVRAVTIQDGQLVVEERPDPEPGRASCSSACAPPA